MDKKTNIDLENQSAKEVKKYFENIISLMPGHVYWKDKNGVLLGCNDLQAKSAGLASREEIVGKTDYELPWKEQADSLRSADLEVMRTGAPKTVEEKSLLADGSEAIFLSKKVPLYQNGKIVGILGISFNITEQKIAEKKLQEAEILKKEHEIVQQQLAVIKTLAATLAHELRTPLAAIKIGTSGIKDYLDDLTHAYKLAKEANLPVHEIFPAQFRLLESALDAIVDETYYANTIINMLWVNIEQLSVRQREFKRCSISHCLEEVLRRYPFQPGDKKLVRWEGNNDFVFMGNELLTVHVLFNLLKNAIYYVKAANKGDVEGSIQIWLTQEKGFNLLHFKDLGKGISKAALPHIFDPFFTRTDHGTGIGLTFCKSVIESYGGTIVCHSTEGEFTEFVLSFPQPAKK